MEFYMDAASALFQIFIFQLVSPFFMRELTYTLALTRNVEWINSHREFLKENPKPSEKSHFLSAVLLVGLTIYFLINKMDYFKWIHVSSAALMGLQYSLVDFIKYQKMTQLIPKGKRSASLVTRRIRDFISPWFFWLTLSLIGFSICVEIVEISLSKELFKELIKLLPMSIAMIIIGGSFWVSYKRAPICDDSEIDNLYRKMEMNVIFVLFSFFSVENILVFVMESSKVDSFFRSTSAFFPLSAYLIFLLFGSVVLKKISARFDLSSSQP